MYLIAHRGNMEGPNTEFENKPNHIMSKLSAYPWLHCEVDVWQIDGEFFLGHDKPQHKINFEFLENSHLWCHAKNLEALSSMLKNPQIHCFWHQEDSFTITSRGYIWTYPGSPLVGNSICVMPERHWDLDPANAAGVCTDHVYRYKGCSG